MSGLTLTLTNAGRAALINAEHTGTAPVAITQIGVTSTTFDPAPTATTVPGEIKRLSTISGKNIAADTVHITIRDESNASYKLRGIGLYLDDGTLFAVYSQSGEIMQKSAQSLLLLSVDIKLLQVAASSVTFGNANFLNPPATTSVQGVVELATNTEAKAGTDTARAITPATLKTVFDTRLPGDMAGKVDKITTAPEDISEKLPSGFYQQQIKTNGWPVPGTAWWHLLSSTNANPNSYYALQLACAFSGDTLYFRSTQGDGNAPWQQVWHAGSFDPDSRLKLTGGTLSGNLRIEKNTADLRLKSTGGDGREIAVTSNATPNTGLYDVTNGGWLFRIDSDNLATMKGFSGSASVYATPAGNATFWLRDETGQQRGLIYWNRSNGALYLQRYAMDSNEVQGKLRINTDGTVTSDHAITAPSFNGTATRAEKLTSSTKINGTSFNGTADIITSRWGAERTLKIGNKSQTVNGAGNVIWTLADIGAAPEAHSHSLDAITGLQAALDKKVANIENGQKDISQKLPSGFYQQQIKTNGWPVPGTAWWHLLSLSNTSPNSYYALQLACAFSGESLFFRSTQNDGNAPWHQLWHSGNFNPDTKLGTSGGTSTGNLTIERSSARVILKSTEETGREIAIISNGTPSVGFRDETNGGQWLFRIGGDNKAHFAGEVNASAFNGNASSADKLKTARTLKIGNAEKTFNGSSNLTWTLSELGYASGGGTNGWMRRPDGIIEQWGLYLMATTSETTRSVTFPIAFPDKCMNVTVSDINPNNSNSPKSHYDMWAQVNHGSLSKTGFSIFIQGVSGSNAHWHGVYWRAIGH